MPFAQRAPKYHPAVGRVMERMQETLANPVPVEVLMSDVRLTRRQVERLFRNELGQSPGKLYMALRLERAKLLLRQSKKPIVEVAIACGFTSASHFAKSYRDAFGSSPHEARVRKATESPGFGGERLAHFPNLPLEADQALEAEGRMAADGIVASVDISGKSVLGRARAAGRGATSSRI